MKYNNGKSGIYIITNLVNGKVYIGKTKNFYKRYYQYLYSIKTKDTRKINNYLLSSIEKYGIENFSFEVLEFCSIELTSERELYWIEFYNSINRDSGYNLRLDSSTGMIVHKDTSEKISNRLKLEWETGIRDGHSDKLKASWEYRDRSVQSKLFSETLTKYKYIVTNTDGMSLEMYYKDLLKNKLNNVISKFHKLKTNIVEFKGFVIERIPNES